MTPENTERLTMVFRTIFNNPALELTPELSAPDVPGWDSFNHVNLIIMVEQEFGIRFTNDEVAGLQNVGELMDLIDAKLDS